jgi:hypothetical protein
LGSGMASIVASGDLGMAPDRLAELARRAIDCRGPMLEERSVGVDDFLSRVGVADRASPPRDEGLRGGKRGARERPGDAREAEACLSGADLGDCAVDPGDVERESF